MAEEKISNPKAKQLRTNKANNKNKKIPEEKVNAIKELKELAETKRTLMIASIKNLPTSQFQEISKKLRGKAVIKVPKKNISLRVINDLKDEEIKSIKEKIGGDVALIFSDMDSFELASELINKKSSVKAKAGQEALEDIVIEEGQTELIPGPAVSELGALGIQIAIEGGKISIKKAKTLVKKGGKISDAAANVMNKLGIKPFLIGFEPIAAFDIKEKKLYTEIKINTKGTIEELKNAFGKALPFAVEIEYFSDETIKLIIAKAGRQEKIMEKFAEAGTSEDKIVINKKSDKKVEPVVEENKELIDEKIVATQEATNISEVKLSSEYENKNAPQLNQGEENK